MYLESGESLRRLDSDAWIYRLLFAPASCPSRRSKRCCPTALRYLSVLLHPHSVNWFVFSLIELMKVASAFSGKIGENPANEFCDTLKPRLLLNVVLAIRSTPPKTLPKIWVFLSCVRLQTNT